MPPTAKAVAVNLAAVLPSAEGFLTLYPTGESAPAASTINFRAGIVRANNAIERLGTGGQLTVVYGAASSATTDFILDVNGYFE